MTPDGDSRLNRAAELSYAGGLTFLKLPLVPDAAGLAGADAAIIGAPMDEAVSDRPGARFGPRAIRLADFFGGSPRVVSAFAIASRASCELSRASATSLCQAAFNAGTA